MNNYKELILWQRSVELAIEIYQATQDFPKTEMFGLTSQIRRSAVSIASNVAEGAGRNSKAAFDNFLGIANGSTCELETQLVIANRVNLLNDMALENLKKHIVEIQKMNRSLKKTLKITHGSTKD